MRWLYLLIGLGAMTVAFFVPQIWVLLLFIVVSFVFILLAAHAWYVERIGTQNHDLSGLIDSVELNQLRERAQERRHSNLSQTDESERNG